MFVRTSRWKYGVVIDRRNGANAGRRLRIYRTLGGRRISRFLCGDVEDKEQMLSILVGKLYDAGRSVSTSVGASYIKDTDTVDSLLARVDEALQWTKQKGGNAVAYV